MPPKKPINSTRLKSLYIRGESVLAISRKMEVSRTVIVRAIRELGLPIRSGSEANKLRMARLTPEERQELSRAAHNAVRGMVRTDIDRETRAKGVQAKGKLSDPEKKICRFLRSLGVEITPLMAVGRYNIDLACEPARIAIEVHGSWHTEERKALQDARKLEALSSNGWLITYLTKDNADTTALRAIAAFCLERARLRADLSHPHQ